MGCFCDKRFFSREVAAILSHPRRQPYLKGWGTPPLTGGDRKKSDQQKVYEFVEERRSATFGYEVIIYHAYKIAGIEYEKAWNMNLGFLLQTLSLYK